MRFALSAVLVSQLLVANLAAEQSQPSSTAETIVAEDGIEFSYEKNNEDPEEVVIVTSGDTVDFEIYYVEKSCPTYEYAFRHSGDSLIVTHLSDGVDCDGDQLYGVKGSLRHVPRGTYRFLLMMADGKKLWPIFKEPVTVR
jgi:hypothetical protein